MRSFRLVGRAGPCAPDFCRRGTTTGGGGSRKAEGHGRAGLRTSRGRGAVLYRPGSRGGARADPDLEPERGLSPPRDDRGGRRTLRRGGPRPPRTVCAGFVSPRDDGNFFPPWNQVDLVFEKSGQPFYWALEFQIGAQKEIKTKKTCSACTTPTPSNQIQNRGRRKAQQYYYW